MGLLLVALISVSAVTYVAVHQIEALTLEVTDSAEPTSAAAYEMEINVNAITQIFRHLPHAHQARFGQRVHDDESDFYRWLKVYRVSSGCHLPAMSRRLDGPARKAEDTLILG